MDEKEIENRLTILETHTQSNLEVGDKFIAFKEEFTIFKTQLEDFLKGTQVYRSELCRKMEDLKSGDKITRDEIIEIKTNCLTRPTHCMRKVEENLKVEKEAIIKEVKGNIRNWLGYPVLITGFLGCILLIKKILGL